MLEGLDLSKEMGQEEYRKELEMLRLQLGEVQRAARDARLPVILVFEGWGPREVARTINRFVVALDPRGFDYHFIDEPGKEEKERPFWYRFYLRTPEKGRIALFDGSWYGRTLLEREGEAELRRTASEIASFERQLAEDGALIIKLFLHMSEERVKEDKDGGCEALDTTSKLGKHYSQHLVKFEKLLRETDSSFTPWTMVEADDRHYATIKSMRTFVSSVRKRLDEKRSEGNLEGPDAADKRDWRKLSPRTRMGLQQSVSDEDYKKFVDDLQKRMGEVQCQLCKRKRSLVVLFEGWDAAGKGGDIQRLAQALNPRAYRVVPVFAPTEEQKAHHYLHRFIDGLPSRGQMSIFDRSWYGRVLVERVEGFCSAAEWSRAYREINEFESMLVDDEVVVVKLWLEVDQEEQLRRFREREQDPTKEWKITSEDWRNRSKWKEYEEAVDEMLVRTSTPKARWNVIPSNDKHISRLQVLRTVISDAEAALEK
jgi:polyphosphate:AMP phosphotransferase